MTDTTYEIDLEALAGEHPEPEFPLVPMLLDPEPEGFTEREGEEDGDDIPFEPVEADLSGEPVEEADEDIPLRRMASRTAGTSEVDTILRALGFRIRSGGERRQAITHFQQAWALGAALKPDGAVGPLTTAALRRSYANHRAGKPDLSAHFSFAEFKCKCGGRYSACARIWIKRAQVIDVEKYRSALGHGVSIVSGCRCKGHNSAVGGASQSRHMAGDATDFPDERSPEWFRGKRLFNGLGYNHSNHEVRHGDQGGVRTWIYA